MKKRLLFVCFALLLIWVMAGCLPNPIANKAPIIESSNPGNTLTVGFSQEVNFSVTATDEDGDSLTYQWTATSGTPTTGTGSSFDWTSPAQAGTVTVKVVVNDGKATANKTWTITVQENAAENNTPIITDKTPATSTCQVNANDTIDFSVTASDADGDELTYSWSCSDGSFDTTSGTGVQWTAPAEDGTATVTVSISDGIISTPVTFTWNVTIGQSSSNVVHVTTNIDSSTTWTSDKVYVIESAIEINALLTIEPGVVVKFYPEGYPSLYVSSTGKIVANGTETSPIVFTSYADDRGGNTDGINATPQPGDWKGIFIEDDSTGNKFDYCEFYYSGLSNFSALNLNNTNTIVTNCTLAYNVGENGALDARYTTTATIQSNRFYGNLLPLSMNPNLSLGTTNTFFSEDYQTGNTKNGIYVDSYPEITTASVTWSEDEVPFILEGAYTISTDSVLNIGDNVILKFMENAQLVVQGVIKAIASNSIIFTSYKDDANGGDTNGDGTDTTPAPGDWIKVELIGTAASTFTNCEFLYGGCQGIPVLELGETPSKVNGCTFAYNRGDDKGALNAEYANAGTIIIDNIFYKNTWPLKINYNFSLDNSNIFHNPSNLDETNSYNGILVENYYAVESDITWKEDEVPFVISGYNDIEVNGLLTIKNDIGNQMVVKFKSDGGFYIKGSIMAENVVFTSFNDDTFCGDTNFDQSDTSPAPGDWYSIDIAWNTGYATFDSCEFYYGGSSNQSTIQTGGDSYLEVDNCIFAHNGTLSGYALDASGAKPNSIITNNRFYSNNYPLFINSNLSIDASNDFVHPTNPAITNTHNGIYVNANNILEANVSWTEAEVPFVIDTSLDIGEIGVLTLADNVILKFMLGGYSLNHYNNLICNFPGVYFTSYRDDAHGGDTDAVNLTPQNTDWEGIYNNIIYDWEQWSNILYDSNSL